MKDALSRKKKIKMVTVLLLTELVMHAERRTIMALWKARSLSPEQKVRIVEESESKSLQTEETGSFLGLEDVYMPEVYSSVLSLPVSLSLSLSLSLFLPPHVYMCGLYGRHTCASVRIR